MMLALTLVIALSSCYKDDSTKYDLSLIDDIRQKSYDAVEFKYMVEKEFAPEFAMITKSNKNAQRDFTDDDYNNFEYSWRISRESGPTADTTTYFLGEGYPLICKVYNLPNSGYDLMLTMKHKETDMTYHLEWPAVVEMEEIGPGLLVAYTRDEGITSDMALIRSYQFADGGAAFTDADKVTGQMPPSVVIPDIFSAGNSGQKADGVISSIMGNRKTVQTPIVTSPLEIVVRDKHIYRLDPTSFEISLSDGQLFYYAPQVMEPKGVYTQVYNDLWNNVFLINGTTAHGYTLSQDGLYRALVGEDLNYELHPDICVTSPSSYLGLAQFFDLKGGRIVAINSGNLQAIPIASPENQPGVFNHNQLSGFEPLFAALSHQQPSWSSMWLLAEKTTGKRFIYILRILEDDPWNAAYGGNIVDMSQCTDFDKSTAWACSVRTTSAPFGGSFSQPEFYYAVGGKIYVVMLPQERQQPGTSATMATSKLVFTLTDPNEEITHLRWHLENGSVFYERDVNGMPKFPHTTRGFSSRNRMMTVGTYNNSTQEGKVYAVPRYDAGRGTLLPDSDPNDAIENPTTPDNPYVGQWGGFGKITAIGVRDRF